MIAIEKLTGIDFFNKPGLQVKILINNTLFNTRELLRSRLYKDMIKSVDKKIKDLKQTQDIGIGAELSLINLSNISHVDKLFKKIANTVKSNMDFIMHGADTDNFSIVKRLNTVLDSCKILDSVLVDTNKLLIKKHINVLELTALTNAVVDLHNDLLVLHVLRIVNTNSHNKNYNIYELYSELCIMHKKLKQFVSNYANCSKLAVENKSIANRLIHNSATRFLYKQINTLEFNKELIIDINPEHLGSCNRHTEMSIKLSRYIKAFILIDQYSNKGIWKINSSSHSCIAKTMCDIAIMNSVLSGINTVITETYIKG